MKFATWFSLAAAAPSTPVNNVDDELLVEPNDDGGWSLRFVGEPESARVGNYATPADAERMARRNCTRVRVLASVSTSEPQPA